MATEPLEDAIANFVSFTSTTREQAISFLKVGTALTSCSPTPANGNIDQANNLDSQKAINAYFEDPTGSQLKVNRAEAHGLESRDKKLTSALSTRQVAFTTRAMYRVWNLSQLHFVRWLIYSFPAFGFGQQDSAPRVPATAPPSRPPSRVNMHEQTEATAFENTSVTASQGTTGEEHTDADKNGFW